MAENIINKFSRSLDQGLASLYNRDQVVDLENQYANQYGVQNTATGPVSDARHMAAMNNLSNSLSPMNNRVGNFIGDIGAFGAGLVNEVPAALTRGFNKENFAAIAEDIAANTRGTFGTPNTTTAEQIFDSVFSRGVPTQTASNISNYGRAQAAGVIGRSTPQDLGFIGMAPSIQEAVAATGRPSMADIAGQINENLMDRGNPLGDSRVASEEQGLVGGIPDRGRGMPGTPTGAYEMVGGTPVAIGDVLGMQQALEKADFVEETPKGLNLGLLGMLAGPAGFLTGSNALKGIGLLSNITSGRAGKFGSLVGNTISRGLGSLAGRMRGINPMTGRPNTQAQYEADRATRSLNNRLSYMTDRKKKGKKYSKKNLAAVQAAVNKGINEGERDALGDPGKSVDHGITGGATRTDIDVADGGAESGGNSKIVCTMMNERYGFGFFRNKIWMKFHEGYSKDYIKGYHAIFLPLVKIAKGEGKINTAVRKVLEHMGRHVTADMFKIMKGKKRDTLGRIYRAIFEPACHIIGKIKSAFGRG